MKNLFIKQEDELKISIWVGESQTGKMVAYPDGYKISDKIVFNGDPEKIDIVFRYPNYRDTIEISDSSNVAFSGNGDVSVKTNSIRFRRICKLIKRWSVKDAEGNQVEPNEENLGTLDPIIGTALCYALEMALGVGNEE